MISAEKVTVNGKDWIKVSFRHNSDTVKIIKKIPGATFNPHTKIWVIPYEQRPLFDTLLSDYLIVWKGEEGKNNGGIDESKIPSKPIVPGYNVVYDENRNIIEAKGFKTKPWGEFQVKGFNALVQRDFLILADDAGLGKSWQVSTAMEARKKLGQVKHGIVITKKSLLFNWRDEIHKHTNEKAVVLVGNAWQRSKIFSDLIINLNP